VTRQLAVYCCSWLIFAHASLIPNLSYVSEAAAYVLDRQLRTHLVPYTDVVYLSSRSFHYPFWDRYAHSRRRKPLPEKPGSFQVFLRGFKDANIFLREHPWPDQYWSGFFTTNNDTHRNRRKRWRDTCRPSRRKTAQADGADGDSDDDETPNGRHDPTAFVWTEPLKQSFREELEKLVILDYIMRNTDRGLDNWMVKVDPITQQANIITDPIQMHIEQTNGEVGPRPVNLSERQPQAERASYPYRRQKPMDASSPSGGGSDSKMTLGAIDNSLSWPWKHPDAWRR
jgi:phosphatidylinositol 4-kinase type 2